MLKILVTKHTTVRNRKIGRNTCENLNTPKNEHITLINRTKDKAEKLAGKLNLIVKITLNCIWNYKSGCCCCGSYGAQNPPVDKAILNRKKPLLILDLSSKNVNKDC
jgi:glutamyl-tRNA reductase